MKLSEFHMPPWILELLRQLMTLAEAAFGLKTGAMKKAWVITALDRALNFQPDDRLPSWFKRNYDPEMVEVFGLMIEIVWGLLFRDAESPRHPHALQRGRG